MSHSISFQYLSKMASEFGFSLLGALSANDSHRVLAPQIEKLRSWQEKGYAAQMSYMERDPELFASLQTVLPEVRSIACFAAPYACDLNDEVLNHIIEFTGEGVKYLNVDQRLTIANMTTEWGALGGVFPIDDITIEWITNRADYINKRGLAGVPSDKDGNGIHPRLNAKRIAELKEEAKILKADNDAYYAKTISFHLETIEPHISGPHNVKTMTSITEMKNRKLKVNKAYLVSCVNSRLEDISEAANVLRGNKIADDVEFYIAAASDEVQKQSEARGDWQALLEAGATPLPPGCGPCIGLGAGLLKDNEVGISATNRNFKGRMGSPNAEAYLASPAIVAYSAMKGEVDFDWDTNIQELKGSINVNPPKPIDSKPIKILEGFPEKIEGDIIFCHIDNMNTDGIYPGKYTYVDDFKPEDQARVAMENYDPEFQNLAREGNILVGGYNFGTGSSREQAATALKYRGIQLVIVGSASQTYKRNALNNGFLVIEIPEFVNDLKEKYGTEKLTVHTETKVKLDYKNSELKFNDKTYKFTPVGAAAQELVVFGGLESWIKNSLR